MKILRGENFISDTSNNTDNTNTAKQDLNLDNISSVDKELRKEIEEENGVIAAINPDFSNNQNSYYIRPVEGVLEQKYDYKRDFLGIDIVTKPKETVKSIADGMVIFSNSGETGYILAIQHKNGLISLYKNNSVLLKQTGEYVKAGDPIGLVGNTDNSGQKYRLHFEIWQDGNSVNPENFISF
ncbi:MAG: M23 family metallopeptidase [Cytophagaceae bacterium]|nr:M23 family metallopeptidase [Cytophagaceae bacterium]